MSDDPYRNEDGTYKTKEIVDRPRDEIFREYNKAEFGYESEDIKGESPVEVSAQVRSHIAERRSKAVELEARGVTEAEEGLAAMERYRASYPAVAQDPTLASIVKAADRLYVEAGDEREPWERYREIAERLNHLPGDAAGLAAVAQIKPEEAALEILRTRQKGASEIVAEMRRQRTGSRD